MAAELTFSPGFVPGLARTTRRAARSAPLHGAAPVSSAREVVPPLTAEQRRALAALIHTPAGALDGRYGSDRRASRVVWMVFAASALAWTLSIAAALLPDVHVARTLDVPRVAMPHVVEAEQAVV